ncbi:MAG: MFS transporter [Propionibacteriaceae bacterium]|nr:MFS transporter [Propionibacteriaceae bacterium]
MNPKWRRTVAWFLVGQAITLFGTMITGHAITWYVTLQTQSGTLLTVFAVATMAPMALSAPFGGVWADRYNRKYLVNLVDAAIALVTLAMALLFSAGFQWIGLLLVCAVVRGLGQGIQMPTVTALIPDLVPPEQLVRVNGFNSSIQSLSLFASPLLAAALLSFFPIQTLMYLDVATAAVGIAIVFFCVHTHKGLRRPRAATGDERPGFWGELKAGLAYIRRRPFALAFTVIGVVFSLLATPAALLTPLQVTRQFGADPWRLGAIEVAFAAGMMAGGVVMGVWGGFRNRSTTMAFACLCYGGGVVGLGLMGNFWVYLAFVAFVGVTMPMFNAPSMAVVQARIDPAFMGRVFSVLTMTGGLAMPAGMVVFGPLADAVDIRWLLVGTGAAVVCLAAVFVANRTVREAGLLPQPSAHDPGGDGEVSVGPG